MTIIWTEYMTFRAWLRGFELAEIERILKHGQERYSDTATGRKVAVGRHGGNLVIIPFETDGDRVTPVTIHATSRQQIRFRLNTGRFIHE